MLADRGPQITLEFPNDESIRHVIMSELDSIYKSENFNLTLIGNKNGLLLVVKNDGTILQKRGIIDEVPVSSLI